MNRSLRRSALAVAAVLLAAPAFAQKTGGPVQVTETEKPAKSAVQIVYSCPQGLKECNTTFVLPAGMRLVVESIIGKISSGSPSPHTLRVATTLNGTDADLWIYSNQIPLNTYYITPFVTSLRLYSDETPFVFHSAPTYLWGDTITMFGYLVKM